jgi:hypothetical protein
LVSITEFVDTLPLTTPQSNIEASMIPAGIGRAAHTGGIPLPLDGAFYEPDGGAAAGAVLLFHGNTINFYVGALYADKSLINRRLKRSVPGSVQPSAPQPPTSPSRRSR